MLSNTQPTEKRREVTDGSVEVHSCFDTTQGEGPYAGVPATFIRMAGCNLVCSGCDTEYSKKRKVWQPTELVDSIEKFYPVRRLVVITGGEPFRQPLGPLIKCLLDSGREVQIETNGTIFDDSLPLLGTPQIKGLSIVCSPKTPALAAKMWRWIDQLKYVVKDGSVDDDGLPLISVGSQYGRPSRPPAHWKGQIYVQPLDVQDPRLNEKNRKAAVDSCMKHNYRLCLQIQKIVSLP